MKSNVRGEHNGRPAQDEKRPKDRRTYADDSGVYRHLPAPVRAFEVVLNVGDRASNRTVGTPDGVHEIDVEIRAHRRVSMKPVLRLRGQASSDGQLELIVRNLETGEARVFDVEQMSEKPEMFNQDEMARGVEKLNSEG